MCDNITEQRGGDRTREADERESIMQYSCWRKVSNITRKDGFSVEQVDEQLRCSCKERSATKPMLASPVGLCDTVSSKRQVKCLLLFFVHAKMPFLMTLLSCFTADNYFAFRMAQSSEASIQQHQLCSCRIQTVAFWAQCSPFGQSHLFQCFTSFFALFTHSSVRGSDQMTQGCAHHIRNKNEKLVDAKHFLCSFHRLWKFILHSFYLSTEGKTFLSSVNETEHVTCLPYAISELFRTHEGLPWYKLWQKLTPCQHRQVQRQFACMLASTERRGRKWLQLHTTLLFCHNLIYSWVKDVWLSV